MYLPMHSTHLRCGIITAIAEGWIPDHLNAPVPAPGPVAAKAYSAESSTASSIKGEKREHCSSIKWRDFLTLSLKECWIFQSLGIEQLCSKRDKNWLPALPAKEKKINFTPKLCILIFF